MKMDWKKYWCGFVLAVIISLGVISGSISTVYAGNSNPRVLPPNSKAFGMTYGEWSVMWWQWAYSLPVDQNPFFDDEGDCSNGANGQFGPVWYLTGVINVSDTAVRNCTVPVGKALFFPIINVECSVIESAGSSESELRYCATSSMDLATNVEADIDGVSLGDLNDYQFSSPLFTFGPLPDNNVLQYFEVDAHPGNTSQAVADGFYLMLPPLSPGPHTIHFTGSIESVGFTLDITYNLTVVNISDYP